jgi:hypothetical protein
VCMTFHIAMQYELSLDFESHIPERIDLNVFQELSIL